MLVPAGAHLRPGLSAQHTFAENAGAGAGSTAHAECGRLAHSGVPRDGNRASTPASTIAGAQLTRSELQPGSSGRQQWREVLTQPEQHLGGEVQPARRLAARAPAPARRPQQQRDGAPLPPNSSAANSSATQGEGRSAKKHRSDAATAAAPAGAAASSPSVRATDHWCAGASEEQQSLASLVSDNRGAMSKSKRICVIGWAGDSAFEAAKRHGCSDHVAWPLRCRGVSPVVPNNFRVLSLQC